MSNEGAVTCELHDRVASLGLNRSHKPNATSDAFLAELKAAVLRVPEQANPLIRFQSWPSRPLHTAFSLLRRGRLKSQPPATCASPKTRHSSLCPKSRAASTWGRRPGARPAAT